MTTVDQVIRTRLEEVLQSELIKSLNFEQKASKLLLKFVEFYKKDSTQFITIAEVRRTFRTIGTDEARLIVGEFEKLGIVIGKYRRMQSIFKFNAEFLQRTDSFGEQNRQRIEKFIGIKRSRRIDYAKKVLREEGITELDDPVVESVLEQAAKEPEYFSQTTGTNNLTVLEKHQIGQCDEDCRLCKVEKGLEL